MLFRNFANQVIGDSRVGSEPRQDATGALFRRGARCAQVERISFAADKSHDVTSEFRHTV